MPEKEKYHSSQAEKIRRYLNGELSASEMHTLEKEALDDPFLADAIEGMQTQTHQQLNAGITDVESRLSKRIEGKIIRMPVSVMWLRAAAVIVILTLIGVAGFFMFNNKPAEENVIAKIESEKENIPVEKTDTIVNADKNETVSVSPPSTVAIQPVQPVIVSKDDSKPSVIQAPANTDKIKDTLVLKSEEHQAAVAKAEQEVIIPPQKANEIIVDNKVRALTGKASGVEVNKGNIVGGNNNVFFYNGQVKDLNNQPVSFANITIKNSNSTTYADAMGNFRFIAADSLLNIDVKSVGFAAQSAVITYREPNPVLLLKPEQNDALKEVVVSGKSKKVKPFVEIKSNLQDTLSDDGIPVAEPVDGWGAYHLYLLNNVKMQKDASGKKIDGMVTVSFLVSESGWLSDFRTEKSLNALADKEAYRLIKEGPKWELYNTVKPMRALVTVIF